MSEIVTYRCSDNKCRLTVHLSHHAPVWKPETPLSLRALSVSAAAQPYVARYRSEAFCHECRFIGERTAEETCARCGSENIHPEQLGLPCPQCKRGSFSIEHLMVR